MTKYIRLSPIRLALVLTVACIGLACLTASSQARVGTDRPEGGSGPLTAPSAPAQWQYLPNDYPENAP